MILPKVREHLLNEIIVLKFEAFMPFKNVKHVYVTSIFHSQTGGIVVQLQLVLSIFGCILLCGRDAAACWLLTIKAIVDKAHTCRGVRAGVKVWPAGTITGSYTDPYHLLPVRLTSPSPSDRSFSPLLNGVWPVSQPLFTARPWECVLSYQ